TYKTNIQNSLPVVRFGSGNIRLAITKVLVQGLTACTFFAVFKAADDVSDHVLLGNWTTGERSFFYRPQGGASTNVVDFLFGNKTIVTTSKYTMTNWRIYTGATGNGVRGDLKVDGISGSFGDVTGVTIGSSLSQDCSIGCLSDSVN